jgi:hypothetical protein
MLGGWRDDIDDDDDDDYGTSFPPALLVADGYYNYPNLTQLSASLCKAQELNKDIVRKLHQFKSTLHSTTSPIKIKHL